MPVAKLTQFARAVLSLPAEVARLNQSLTAVREAIGRVEARLDRAEAAQQRLSDHEFKVYSQWGEDGIIQHLLNVVPVVRPVFVEFGVENYAEANTRFLLLNNNWSGLIIDGSEANMASVRNEPLYWRHTLKAVCGFVTRENINHLLRDNALSGEIGLLSIDIDGNDYWVWESIDVVNPAIVVIEYNARFGPERAVTTPYDPAFVRQRAHHSCIYYGASLAALVGLGRRKGYAFVGSNSAANNAFFVRRDLLPASLPARTSAEEWRPCMFREARDENGALRFLTPEEERAVLAPLKLVEVEA
jgi:hypothetical protein